MVIQYNIDGMEIDSSRLGLSVPQGASHGLGTPLKKGDSKLVPKFVGPYQICRKVGSLAYELCLPEGSQFQPVFHITS